MRETGWAHVPCSAHTLNLIVQENLKQIVEILEKIKSLVEYFRRSPHGNFKLISMQKRMSPNSRPIKLKNDVATKWNSTYLMLQRLLQLQDPITATIALLNNAVNLPTEQE